MGDFAIKGWGMNLVSWKQIKWLLYIQDGSRGKDGKVLVKMEKHRLEF